MKAFKRLNSIADNTESNYEFDHSLLKQREEIELFESIKRFKNNKGINSLKIDEVCYEKISCAINNFLDNIMVNAKEKMLRINRKLLLAKCKKVLSANFNFSTLQIDD